MKTCPNCNNQLDDNAVFCTSCGAQINNSAEQAANEAPKVDAQPAQNVNNAQNYQNNFQAPPPQYAPAYDPYDHTSEFDAQDISDNKVFAMCVYLLGTIGIIIALLASRNSKFVDFHLRQGLKFVVIEILIAIVTVILCWTIIVPIAAGIACAVLTVLEIICFFQVCQGKAKEAPIIRSLKFLK